MNVRIVLLFVELWLCCFPVWTILPTRSDCSSKRFCTDYVPTMSCVSVQGDERSFSCKFYKTNAAFSLFKRFMHMQMVRWNGGNILVSYATYHKLGKRGVAWIRHSFYKEEIDFPLFSCCYYSVECWLEFVLV